MKIKKLLSTIKTKKESTFIPEIICLTGKMASGKNYISKLLLDENSVSVDLDNFGHMAINSCKDQIYNAFNEIAEKKGINLKKVDGSIDRRALGSLIFSDKALIKKQESIVYPEIIKLTKDFIKQNKEKTIYINATLLFKTPELMKLCSKIYFVKSNFFVRLYRAKKRDNLPLGQILKRFLAQKDLLKNYKLTGKPIIFIKN
ncbi:MAG: dephospho-CoA kinase [Treponema sp.]|nr:dephospho-CoA kinase [Treponema sp.]